MPSPPKPVGWVELFAKPIGITDRWLSRSLSSGQPEAGPVGSLYTLRAQR
jgi:hypothetical protein